MLLFIRQSFCIHFSKFTFCNKSFMFVLYFLICSFHWNFTVPFAEQINLTRTLFLVYLKLSSSISQRCSNNSLNTIRFRSQNLSIIDFKSRNHMKLPKCNQNWPELKWIILDSLKYRLHSIGRRGIYDNKT